MPEASSVTDAAGDLEAIRLRWFRLLANTNYADDWVEWDDVPVLLDEVERLRAQVAAQAEVVEAARVSDSHHYWDNRLANPGYVNGLHDALARLDALEHAQRNAAAVTQLQPSHGGQGVSRYKWAFCVALYAWWHLTLGSQLGLWELPAWVVFALSCMLVVEGIACVWHAIVDEVKRWERTA